MAFLHWHNGFEVHPCGSLHHLLFVLPNNISCYGHVPHFYLSIHPWLGIWVVFCYLVTSDAAVNTPVRAAVCVCVLISLEYSPGSGAAGSHVNWVFNIWKTRQTVFQSVCPRMHPHQQGTRAPAPPVLPTLATVCLLDASHRGGGVVGSRCGFDLHFPSEHLFMCAVCFYTSWTSVLA